MMETMFLLGSILYAITLGCVIYIYEDKVKGLNKTIRITKSRHRISETFLALTRSDLDEMTNLMKSNQLKWEAKRRDILNEIEELQLNISVFESTLEFSNNYVRKLHDAVYYCPRLNEILTFDDLTSIGEL